jgi:hypothetical protein
VSPWFVHSERLRIERTAFYCESLGLVNGRQCDAAGIQSFFTTHRPQCDVSIPLSASQHHLALTHAIPPTYPPQRGESCLTPLHGKEKKTSSFHSIEAACRHLSTISNILLRLRSERPPLPPCPDGTWYAASSKNPAAFTIWCTCWGYETAMAMRMERGGDEASCGAKRPNEPEGSPPCKWKHSCRCREGMVPVQCQLR